MKKTLDSETREIVDIFDEVTLWSAPFGRLLLENIPMKSEAKVVDIGFGTGFPLIELSQRFGGKSKIYGIDIWKEAIRRVKHKISTLEITNIEIIEGNASKIRIEDKQIDLVTSNLGVNNFEQKKAVYREINRILKKGGRLSITTNPMGTFRELFELFELVLKEMELKEGLKKLNESIKNRSTEKKIILELEQSGFKFLKSKPDSTNIRFANAKAVMDHSLIRIGFRASWEKIIPEENRVVFFEKLTLKINNIIETRGEFIMTIPMLYLEFKKE